MRYNLFLLLITIVVSCKHEPLIPPAVLCDTTNSTYHAKIETLIREKCVSCHSPTILAGGIDLTFYTNVKIYVDDGSLWSVALRDGRYPPMPPDSTQRLDECQLANLNKWIREGALNN